jgi:putative oxidoreductase
MPNTPADRNPSQADERKLALALAILRISLGGFLLLWALEKFVIPQATVAIWKSFYLTAIGVSVPYVIGAFETLLALGIIIGFQRRITYGAGLIIHAVSVVSSWRQLIDPWGLWLNDRPQHLFLAGVPVLAGFLVLYLLREADRWTVDGRRLAAK